MDNIPESALVRMAASEAESMSEDAAVSDEAFYEKNEDDACYENGGEHYVLASETPLPVEIEWVCEFSLHKWLLEVWSAIISHLCLFSLSFHHTNVRDPPFPKFSPLLTLTSTY